MHKILIPVFLIFTLSACSPGSTLKYDSSYKSLEHGGEYKHSPQELYQECLQIKKEINVLKAKSQSVKGPGYEMPRKQIETDIKWLSGKYKEADCDNVISSTPPPAASEEMPPESQTAEHEHIAEGTQPAKDVNPAMSLSFDDCFKKCKELTSRTNEECFDTCLDH